MTKPIATLFVSNVPRGTSEDELKTFIGDSIRDELQVGMAKKSDEVTTDLSLFSFSSYTNRQVN